MTLSKTFVFALIGLLIAIIVLQRTCNKPSTPSVTTKTDTVYITVHDTITEHVPVPYEVIREGKPYPVTKSDTVFSITHELEKVDTANILADYFSTRVYSDSTHAKYADFIINDTLTQNKIRNRKVFINWKLPVVTTTKTINKGQLYIGLDIGSNGKTTIGFGPQLDFKTKSDQLYNAGINYIPSIGPYYHIGALWKIHL